LQFDQTQHYELKSGGLSFERDFAFVIDTTGTMGSSINAVKSQAAAMIDALFADGKIDARVGVVGFKDTTNGEPSSIILPFTDQDDFAARKSAALAAINSITVGGGGDIPETDDDGLLHALNGDMGQWRVGAGVHQIALFTDAPVKDIGIRAQVEALANNLGATIVSHSSLAGAGGSVDTFSLTFASSAGRSDPGDPNGAPPPTVLHDDPITPDTTQATLQIFTIFTGPSGTDTSALSDIASSTGGSFFTAPTNDELLKALFAIITGSTISPPPAGTSADMIMRDGTNGDNEIFDIGRNAVLAAYPLGHIGPEWQVAGLGGFYGTDTSDMLMRRGSDGEFLVVDISNNVATGSAFIGQAGMEWQVAGFGDFSGNPGETDMLMRNSSTGVFLIYDISNNAVTNVADIGQLGGLEWTVAGFGDFSGRAGETDMLMRDSYTGQFEIYDIGNNAVTSAATMGQAGLEWTVAGFGDFSGNAGESDMLMRNSNTGAFEVYDISHNAVTSAVPMGQVGFEWTVAGFGDFSGNANETDMLMRNSKTGAFEVLDISHNAVTSAASMGQVGLEWQVGGIAADPPAAGSPAASTALLVQAMASFGASAAVTSAPGNVPGGADASQPTLLSIPQHA
jgi:hypothetical protein